MGFLVNSFSVSSPALPDPTIPTISNQILWLKSSDGITKDGSDLVSSWADQSGQGNTLAQTTGSKQPLWVDDTVGGYPAVKFDGTNDRLFRSTLTGGTMSQPVTYCAVLEFQTGGYLSGGGSGVSSTRQAMIAAGSSQYNMYAGANLNGGSHPSGYYGLIYEFNGSSSEAWDNGVSVLTGNASTQVQTGLSLATRFNDTGFGNPNIAEFIIYNKTLTSGELSSLTTYFNERYSL